MLFRSIDQAEARLLANWRWPNFSVSELACKCRGRFCAGEYWHDADFLDRLQALRDAVGGPLLITSAHRCAQWNAVVGGAPLSHHRRIAVDIALDGHDRFALRQQAERLGFRGFGLARSFLHLDRRARPACWYYKGSKHLWEI